MEITNVSSEDLSVYSYVPESPLSDNESNDNIGARKSGISNTNSQQRRRLESLKKIRTNFETSRKNNVKPSLNPHESKKTSGKPNPKNNLTVSTQNRKLTNKPLESSATFRNASSTKKKSPLLSSSKHKTSKVGNVVPSNGTETVSDSKSKKKVIVEVEVFMPVIDVENNTITYPKSREPIVRVYHPQDNDAKSRSDKRGTSYMNKKNIEGPTKSYLHSKPKKEAKSNKNVPNSIRKGNVGNASKTSLEKHVKEEKCVVNTATDVGNTKRTHKHRSSIKDAKTKVHKVTNLDKVIIDSAAAAGSGRQRMAKDFQNLLMGITNDPENVPVSNSGELQERMTFPLPIDSECRKTFPRANSSEEACLPENKRVRKIIKTPSAIICDFVEDEDVDLSAVIAESRLSQSDDEIDKHGRERHSQKNEKPKPQGPRKDSKVRNATKYRQLYPDKRDIERKESNYTSPGSQMKISNIENGWKRITPRNSSSSECFPTKSKWRRNIKDDGLPIDCWIERCKYLQTRQQYYESNLHTDNWRPS